MAQDPFTYTDKVDIYSFGVVVWEMLTRQVPFPKTHTLAVGDIASGLMQLEEPQSGADYLKRLFRCCTQFDPTCRPSLANVVSDLERVTLIPDQIAKVFPSPSAYSYEEQRCTYLFNHPTVRDSLNTLTGPVRETAANALRRVVHMYASHRRAQQIAAQGVPAK